MFYLPGLYERQVHIADVVKLECVVDLIDQLHACSLLDEMSYSTYIACVVFEARSVGAGRIWVLKKQLKLILTVSFYGFTSN